MSKVIKTTKHSITTKLKDHQQDFYVIYEDLWSSIIIDFWTFTCITLAFLFNHLFIGSRLFSILLFFGFYVTMYKTFTAKTMELKPQEFIEKLIKDIGEQNEIK